MGLSTYLTIWYSAFHLDHVRTTQAKQAQRRKKQSGEHGVDYEQVEVDHLKLFDYSSLLLRAWEY